MRLILSCKKGRENFRRLDNVEREGREWVSMRARNNCKSAYTYSRALNAREQQVGGISFEI